MRFRGREIARATTASALVLALVAVVATWRAASAQVAFPSGQNVVPVYEGWLPNPDGSFDMVFGYFNRNFVEELDVPVGPDNTFEPGASADQGQPTHFYPRRSRFLFHIHVPKDFGNKELVWTINTHGKVERAYGSLKPDYGMDDIVIMNNSGAGGSGGGGNHLEGNQPPTLEVTGEKSRTVRVGDVVMLAAISTDDGIPKRRVIHSSGRRRTSAVGAGATAPPAPAAASEGSQPSALQQQIGTRCCPDSASGLRVSWSVYRGPAAKVKFDPEQLEAWEDYRDGRNSPYSEGWEPPALPPDNKWTAHVTFMEPGTYVLRCLAHDGGLFTLQDVTFTVTR